MDAARVTGARKSVAPSLNFRATIITVWGVMMEDSYSTGVMNRPVRAKTLWEPGKYCR